MGAPELVAEGLPPKMGTFLDVAAFQKDAMARRELLREVECFTFEHRQHPLLVPEREPVDEMAPTGTECNAQDWVEYLHALDAEGVQDRGVRCVRVAPPATAVQPELHRLWQAGVGVRLVDTARAARSLLPEVLVMGDRCAYVLVRRKGVLVGAVYVSDLRRVRRWLGVLRRLYARGARLDPDTAGPAGTGGEE